MSNFNIFAQLVKYDESTGEFEAIAADQSIDHAKERFHYETSKPYFQAWSDRISKATDGKSAGNLRAMHGKTVAGKITQMLCDDSDSAIKIKGVVVDPIEKKKYSEGCYAGVSIGGSYINKWDDESNPGVMWYTADPAEISIVDNPCNPNAYFKLMHSDGSEELRKFHPASAEEGASPASAATNTDAQPSADADLSKFALSKFPEMRKQFEDGKITAAELLNWTKAMNTQAARENADYARGLDELMKIAERSDTTPGEGESKYGDVKFADEKNKKYPIDTPAHIRAAWNYINKPKNQAKYDAADVKTIKSKIVAAWKDKIDSNGPPSADKEGDTEKMASADSRIAFLAKHEPAQRTIATLFSAYGKSFEKGLYSVADLACLVDNLSFIASGAQMESEWEGDNSAVPGELRDAVKELAGILLDMADEEVEELVTQYEGMDVMVDDDALVIELAAKVGELAKAGATYSAATKAHLQTMHDTLTKMVGNGMCEDTVGMNDEADKHKDGELSKVAKGVLDEVTHALEKSRGENRTLLAKVADMQKRIHELEKLPAAKAPVLRVVGKDQVAEPASVVKDVVADVKPVTNPAGKVDDTATFIKGLHAKRGQA